MEIHRYEGEYMIDPMVSLAFSVYSNKGAYALLLGSGVSRSSGIPTGWEVVLDLVRKVARLHGEDCEPNPEAWFSKKYGSTPDYSKLLHELGKSPSERQQLLRGYFEPTEDERNQGQKMPSPAHRAIAKLAAAGYVKVIITTNFDRLIESALEEVGVTSVVITTTDQINGAIPLVHSGVTVVKLHGDYLDTRIKNTEEELASYDGPLNKFLDRVFDEYGLIVSGWSGDWDIALRSAIERCPNRRFTTFWTSRSDLRGFAERLATHRNAVAVKVKSADDLFGMLSEKVAALEDLAAPHPLSAKIAIAAVKRHLVDETAKIRLHDLVFEEAEKVVYGLNAEIFSVSHPEPDIVSTAKRARQYEALIDCLLGIVISGCYWGEIHQLDLWIKSIEKVANSRQRAGHAYDHWNIFKRYPAMLLVYGGGIAAISAQKYDSLYSLLVQTRFFDDGRSTGLVGRFPLHSVSYIEDQETGKIKQTRLPWFLFHFFKPRFSNVILNEEDFRLAFDRFEYFYSLFLIQNGRGVYPGLYFYQADNIDPESRIPKVIERELSANGNNCPYLKAGLFGGTVDEFKKLQSELHAHLSRVSKW